VDQLTSVMEVQRTFFFNNWITEYNRERLEEMRDTPPGELESDPAYEAVIRDAIPMLLANVTVENVGFYFDANQRLCGAQQVTVRQVSKVFDAVNKVVRHVMRDQAARDDKSAEEKRSLLAFANAGKKALRIEGNQLEVQMPLSEADFLEFKNHSPQGAAFTKSGGVKKLEDGVLVLTIGGKDAKSGSLTMPFSGSPYNSKAVAHARKYGIKESFDAAQAARDFLKLGE
jgi:hypothetical protein